MKRLQQMLPRFDTLDSTRDPVNWCAEMTQAKHARRFRFGIFEADASTGELRRQGIRVRLKAQPFQLLLLLLERPGELVTREEICRDLWPDDTFVDYEHGVNSAINRLREALGDAANRPRYIETLPRKGYRFLAPVQREGQDENLHIAADVKDRAVVAVPVDPARRFGSILASAEDLPSAPRPVVQALFVLLQLMYLGFYIAALANLEEIRALLTPLPFAFTVLVATAVLLVPVRAFAALSALFRAPHAARNLLRLWPFLLAADVLWALSPLLLIHHIPVGLALACTPLLVYSPFAQRSLVLMGAAGAIHSQQN